MKKFVPLLLLFSALFTSQCCKHKSNTSAAPMTDTQEHTDPTPNDDKNQDMGLMPIRVKKEYQYNETDPFTVLDLRCSGDTLMVDVEYGGGCEKHEFTMVSNNLWLKSLPPQLTLYLEHKANNDMCRALIRKTLQFDLKEVRFPGGKEMRLFVNNDRSKEAMYRY